MTDIDTPADRYLSDADIEAADRLRFRLWLALIDTYVDSAHLDVAWQSARTIDTHWQGFAQRMYAEGFEAGLRERDAEHRLKELELAVLTAPMSTTHDRDRGCPQPRSTNAGMYRIDRGDELHCPHCCQWHSVVQPYREGTTYTVAMLM